MGQLTIHTIQHLFWWKSKVNYKLLQTQEYCAHSMQGMSTRNELSQHRVHDKQTATLLPHYLTQTCLQGAKNAFIANKQTQWNIRWCTHQQVWSFYGTQRASWITPTHHTEIVALHWSVKTWAQIEGGPVDNLVMLNNSKSTVTLLLATQIGLLPRKPHTTWGLMLTSTAYTASQYM